MSQNRTVCCVKSLNFNFDRVLETLVMQVLRIPFLTNTPQVNLNRQHLPCNLPFYNANTNEGLVRSSHGPKENLKLFGRRGLSDGRGD